MDIDWDAHGWEGLGEGVGRRRLPGWDATVGLVTGRDGVLLYDTGSTLAEGAELRAQVSSLTGGRSVTHVALGHPHFDHVFGTAAFPGAEVYGAAGLAALLRREAAELLADAVRQGVDAGAAAEAAEALVAPGHEVAGELVLDLGGRRVVLANAGPGHTGHDLALLVPGTPAVVFCGDLVEESGEPQAGPDALPARWPAAVDRLLALGGADARYVPGHGAVVDAAFVRRQRAELARRAAVS
ncbi:MBL fold metallo-hydrolase [Streptomyces sp. NPDC046203]|uniref:MBL fold metallo-hydrolase n=1 Tax=Streptomyces sp. NPDC046203 TaxID=3154602 RepID=UPI003409C590